MFDTARITDELRDKLWTKVINTVIDWYNVMWSGKLPVWTRKLKIFEEIGIIKKIEK